jgi:hypothetical protein
MGHMQQLTAIVAMAETVGQLRCGVRRGIDARFLKEALDLLRQAVAPDPDE